MWMAEICHHTLDVWVLSSEFTFSHVVDKSLVLKLLPVGSSPDKEMFADMMEHTYG
jgi:hypothetical protein